MAQAERNFYTRAGACATEAHRAGGSTFPSYSKTAQDIRSVGRQGLESVQSAQESANFSAEEKYDLLKKTARKRSAEIASDRLQLSEELDNFSQACTRKILQKNQLLNGLTMSQWYSFPHTCPAMQLSLDMSTVSQEVLGSLGPVSKLSSAWQQSHVAIAPLDEKPPPLRRQRRCWRLERCLCKPSTSTASCLRATSW